MEKRFNKYFTKNDRRMTNLRGFENVWKNRTKEQVYFGTKNSEIHA